MTAILNKILEMFRGPRGYQGEPGPLGPAGLHGLPSVRGEQGIQGPPGLPGPKGDRGPIWEQGVEGQQGKDASGSRLINLPVDVVLVSEQRDLDRIMDIRRAMERVAEFWSQTNIDIQPRISGWLHAEDILQYKDDALALKHYWEAARSPLTVYIGSNSARVGDGYLGQAAPLSGLNGTAIMAGAYPEIAEPATLVSEIFNHELGHILGLDHDESTFMRAKITGEGNVISVTQTVAAREAAYRWGGY